jgi:demethylmenaquinone methyltransferase/2-methoxy-6-polyprenyl-1,4-benzoquinol methylase
MFDMIATRYDIINRILAVGMDVGWRRRMVHVIQQSVKDTANPKLLDMATGTADVALMLRREIPSATVLGLDPSNNMLEVGRDKVRQAGFAEDISLQLADAQDFSSILPASSFDAATMAFGIRNVPDRQRALCQIHTVLRDQARFCILEFSEPDDSFGLLGRGARLFIRYVVPFIGGILSGAPKEYWHLQKSVNEFPSPPEFGKILGNLQCDGNSGSHEEGAAAPESKGGSFRLDEILQLNFGSVQIYVTTVLKPNSEES